MNIQQVQTIIADAMEKHNGIVKKEELTRLGIDYRLSLIHISEPTRP